MASIYESFSIQNSNERTIHVFQKPAHRFLRRQNDADAFSLNRPKMYEKQYRSSFLVKHMTLCEFFGRDSTFGLVYS